MLADIEDALVDLLKKSPLANRLAEVDSLPDLEGENLVSRFATKAPAIYVALGSFPITGGAARLKFGIACVAKNSRGHRSARHGDGIAIGLYEIIDAVLPLIDGASIEIDGETMVFEAVSCDQVSSEALYKNGLQVAVVQVHTTSDVDLPEVIDEGRLTEFRTFASDFDIDNKQPATEHKKWLDEPPNHGTSQPDLSDRLHLQE